MSNQTEATNDFMGDILREIGTIPISSTQEFRVLLVRDKEQGGVKISTQKWWRKSTEDEWNVGKGFFLTGRQAISMGKMLTDIGAEIINVR